MIASLEMLEDDQVKSVVLTSNEIKITPVTQQNTIYKMTYYTGLINMDTGLVERLQKARSYIFKRYFWRFVGNWLYAVDIITSFLAFYGADFLYLPYDEQRHRRNDGGWKKYRKVYVQKETGVTFKDVAGQEEAMDSLNELVDFLHNPKKYTNIGAKLPKEALLVGPPEPVRRFLQRQ